MRTLLFAFVIIFLFSPSQAKETPTPVVSKIKEVTVFVNGAQINRTGTVALKAGNQQIVFENLPQAINHQSVQVSGTGNFTILSVNTQQNFLKQQEKSKEIMNLEDSLEVLQERLKSNNTSMEVLKDEETLLKANQSLGGSQTGVKVEELKAAAELFRTRLTDIRTKLLKITGENKRVNEKIQAISNQLTQLRNKKNIPTSEVTVAISAQTSVQAQLTLSYLVNDAGWVPAYDVRAVDISKPIDITYKAKIAQSTGEDWDNIKLTVSTGNPEMSGNSPILYPWYLSLEQPFTRLKGAAAPVAMDAPAKEMEEVAVVGYGVEKKAKTLAMQTQVQVNQTMVDYTIQIPYDIPSDGQQYTAEIKSFTLPATYEYYCVPKMDPDAFLVAKITGWEELNLQSGETSLFFEGKYIGSAYIDVQNTKDTLDISLGRDKSITVTRTRLKDFSSKQFIGPNRKESRSFEIAVKNKKKQPITLVINDQIPLSTTKEIEIELTKLTGGSVDNTTGKITWKLQLQPSESKTLNKEYSVNYPKDKKVILE